MCKSLPASHLAFSLYEACPFELPPVDKSAFCLTTPADDSGAAHPAVKCGGPIFQFWYRANPLHVRDDFRWASFDALDAPEWLPTGSHMPTGVLLEGTPYAFCSASGFDASRGAL